MRIIQSIIILSGLGVFIGGLYHALNFDRPSNGTCYSDSYDYGQPLTDVKQIVLTGRDGFSYVSWDDRMQKWNQQIYTRMWDSKSQLREIKCPGRN